MSNRLMSHRNLTYLNNNRIIYRRLPTTDIPDIETKEYLFFKEGTHQCYELFRSSAKINTYKSLKWHLLVMWYLNPQLGPEEFNRLAEYIAYKPNGFVTFNIKQEHLAQIIYGVSMMDLEEPPKNKLRKVVFKPFTGLTKEQKLSIVGSLIGVTNKVHPDDIYECMIDIHDMNQKITIGKLAAILKVSTRTIHRHMCEELKREKELLNQQL